MCDEYGNKDLNNFMADLKNLLKSPKEWTAFGNCNAEFAELIKIYSDQNKTLSFLLKNDLFDSVKQLTEDAKKLNSTLTSTDQAAFKQNLKDVHNLFRIGIFSKGSAIKNIMELKNLLEEHNRKLGAKNS